MKLNSNGRDDRGMQSGQGGQNDFGRQDGSRGDSSGRPNEKSDDDRRDGGQGQQR